MPRIFLLFLLPLILLGCGPKPPAPQGPYDLAHPTKTWTLPPVLSEVSDIAFDPHTQYIAMVQDERVAIYRFDTQRGILIDTLAQGPPADIEALTPWDNTWLIAASDGTLWHWQGDSLSLTKLSITADNNLEGMTGLPQTDDLLLALKGDPLPPSQDTRTILRYSITQDSLHSTPYLTLQIADIANTEAGADRQALRKAKSKGKKKKDPKLAKLFQPSGIAIHPQTQETYLLSAASPLLAIYTPQGQLKAAYALPEQLLPKAEGICFSPQGHLYIATEAKDKQPPRLHCFVPKP